MNLHRVVCLHLVLREEGRHLEKRGSTAIGPGDGDGLGLGHGDETVQTQ